MDNKSKVIAPILILVVLALVGFGVVGYLVLKPVVTSPSPTPTPTTTCVISGCNGEICQGVDEEPLTSICLYKPEHACFKNAICERQESGKCGWTQTEELNECLEKYK